MMAPADCNKVGRPFGPLLPRLPAEGGRDWAICIRNPAAVLIRGMAFSEWHEKPQRMLAQVSIPKVIWVILFRGPPEIFSPSEEASSRFMASVSSYPKSWCRNFNPGEPTSWLIASVSLSLLSLSLSRLCKLKHCQKIAFQ